MRKIGNLLCLMFIFCFIGCGKDKTVNNEDASSKDNSSVSASLSEDNFEWEGNIIIALTEAGAKQKAIVIPERCEGFNGSIFASVENDITSVSFESDKNVDLNGVFGCATNVKYIDLPNQLTEIEDCEFWLCAALEEIEIPASVVTIGKYAFQDNTSLKEVRFAGNVETIASHAFDGCSTLNTIVFPDTISLIDEYAFFECISLKSITLPKELKTVGAFAFANSGITDIMIPKEVSLEGYATTSFVQIDHDINIHITEGSWIDQNFESVFDGAYDKQYN